MALKLEDVELYGQFLAISVPVGGLGQEVGEGVVMAVGVEVTNYTLGRVLRVGDHVLFREGAQTSLVGAVQADTDPGRVVVFVSMGNIIATIGEPPAPA